MTNIVIVLHAGIRKIAGRHVDQVLPLSAGRASDIPRTSIRVPGRRHGVRRAQRDRVSVHTGGRRADVRQLGRMASGEPDVDRSAARDADNSRAHTRGGHLQGQGNEDVLQLAVGRGQDGREPAQRRAVRQAGRLARG